MGWLSQIERSVSIYSTVSCLCGEEVGAWWVHGVYCTPTRILVFPLVEMKLAASSCNTGSVRLSIRESETDRVSIAAVD